MFLFIVRPFVASSYAFSFCPKWQGGGIPRRNAPILQKIREEVSSLLVCFFFFGVAFHILQIVNHIISGFIFALFFNSWVNSWVRNLSTSTRWLQIQTVHTICVVIVVLTLVLLKNVTETIYAVTSTIP